MLIKNKAGWTTLKDKERVDDYTRIGDSIFCGEIGCNVPSLKNVDVSTFEVYPGAKYARDKNYVYYPIIQRCVDYEDCGVCYYEKVIVEKANPNKFKYLGKDYATDGTHAYFRGQIIKNADGETFKVIDGPEYFFFATDKFDVYKHDKIFKNADPGSFKFNSDNSRNRLTKSGKRYIISDKNNTWEYIPPDQVNKIE